MHTPKFWEDANKIGNALYRINQSEYKEFCEIDQFWVFLADTFPNNINEIQDIFQQYAEHVEERTRIMKVKELLNNPEIAGKNNNIKYKLIDLEGE